MNQQSSSTNNNNRHDDREDAIAKRTRLSSNEGHSDTTKVTSDELTARHTISDVIIL